MAVLVCFALKEEAAAFRKIAAGKSGVIIHIVGMGRRNAEKSIRDFIAAGSPRLDVVLTCGFAGGLKTDLKVGDVLFEIPKQNAEVSEYNTKSGGGIAGSDLELNLVAAGARPAKFFCADRVAVTVAEKNKLRAETGADAVEMESAAIHGVCRERG